MNIHPLIKDSLNEEQQKAVVQMNNVVVAAGAGSGKTRVLAYRYAHLVIEHGFTVESILTLTFTKKATSEMYDRIYTTLKKIACSKDSTELQKQRADEAIKNFFTARIQTIDSFAASILRGSSRIFGIRPDFSIDNDEVKRFLKKRALDYMLEYRKNAAFTTLIGNGKFEDIVDDLFVNPTLYFSNLGDEHNFFESLNTQISTVTYKWKKNIEKVLSNKSEFESASTNLSVNFACIDTHIIDETYLERYFSVIKDECDTLEKRLIHTEKLRQELVPLLEAIYALTKLNRQKKEYKAISQVIDAVKESYDVLTAIAQYTLYFSHTLDILPALQKYIDEITEWKRTTGILTYSDVSSLALRTLLDNPEIRYSEKLKTSAIMIDEFQDNNSMQKDMLFLLAENLERNEKSVPSPSELCPEKLFFVGDEKQSIYKFRGADVSIFRELKNDLRETLQLSTNYRSKPQIIAGYNSIFGGYEYVGANGAYDDNCMVKRSVSSPSVFLQEFQLPENHSFPIYEAEYTKIFSRKNDTDCKEEKNIHICLLDSSTYESTRDEDSLENDSKTENLVEAENLAIFTAEKIVDLCDKGYKPKDIAILFRSYSKQPLYEKHLRRLGIPYATESITNFFADAPVNDLLAFVRLLVYPRDTQAFSTLLRSPFVNLTQQETISCLLEIEKNDLDLYCLERAQHLSGESKNRYIKTLGRYNDLRQKIGILSCSEIIHELWYIDGYRYETMWNKDVMQFSEIYDYLFEIARKIDTDGYNIAYFIDYLYELDKNSERLEDLNIPLERAGAVQLMSIHKSKGLEFPVVFVAGVSSKGRSIKNSESIFIDTHYGPSINFPSHPEIKNCQRNYFFNAGKILEKQKEEAELRRLLYVAMTRAEHKVYITGSFSINAKLRKTLEKSGIDLSLLKDEDLYPVLSEVFLQKVKEKDTTKNLSQVSFEYCVQNETLFAFLLPIIAHFNVENSPFTLSTIKSKTREDLQREDKYNRKAIVTDVLEHATAPLLNANVITTPIVKDVYRSPSHLTDSILIDIHKGDNLDKGEHSIKALDEIIARKNEKLFNYSHFGTLCHAYAESLFTKLAPKVKPELNNVLDKKELETVCAIAENMVKQFSTSFIGIEACEAKWQKTEYDFKLFLKKNETEKVIIKGQIDLLYEKNDGKLVIIDYKTDSLENPSHHIAQLAAYRRAVSKIYNRSLQNIQCILYYLRSGNNVDITNETNKINLEKLVFDRFSENGSSL